MIIFSCSKLYMPYKFITNLRTKWKREDNRLSTYHRKVTNCDCAEEKILYDTTECIKRKKTSTLTKFDTNGNSSYHFSYNTHHKNIVEGTNSRAACNVQKFSNSRFQTQGGVSSSSRIARLKYDTRRTTGELKQAGAARIDLHHVVKCEKKKCAK